MLQFSCEVDRQSTYFSFQGIKPNAGPNNKTGTDYCGQGGGGRNWQKSIDRGMFYVWADKIGTCRDEQGKVCVDGNYFPAWVEEAEYTYQVFVDWPKTLWRQYKLAHNTYDSYLPKCRDNYCSNKRNLDAIVQREEEDADREAIGVTTKRVRSNPEVYRPFPEVPAATQWLQRFGKDELRYPVLVVLATSGKGKTEWAKSLFKHPLTFEVGEKTFFPDGMRAFSRHVHDGIVLDDVRDLAFVTNHQEKLQGKYDLAVEFASTQGGTCAFKKYLFATPVVVTCNFSTANLGFLHTHDWLGKDLNRVVVNL